MPDSEFRPLRLRGGRFDEASAGTVGFPLEAASELARYERLLIEVARGLWMADHSDRQRAPKRFDESLRLRLTSVESGSVTPVLQRLESPSVQLFDDGLIDKSQRTIADTVAAVVAEQPLPHGFPKSATETLLQFGSGLRSDEQYILPRNGDGADVVYTQDARRHLVRITSPDNIKIDGELIGRIGGIDANRQEFQFSDRVGQRVSGRFEQHGLLAEIKDFTDRDPDAPFVRLSCRYSTDAEGHLSAIENVEDVETVVSPDDPMGLRLRTLLELTDGWHDGAGTAPDVAAVEWARDFVAEIPEDHWSELRMFPTVEGGVLVERQVEARRWSLEIERDGTVTVIIVSPGDGSKTEEPGDVATAAESLAAFLS